MAKEKVDGLVHQAFNLELWEEVEKRLEQLEKDFFKKSLNKDS